MDGSQTTNNGEIVRRLASVRIITAIEPIPDADKIETATVDGWKVVVKKGDFEVGDPGLYFEIDSWVPQKIAPFLYKGRSYNDVPGERLRTVKLRKQISQGLLIPLAKSVVNGEPRYALPILDSDGQPEDFIDANPGDNLTEILGIQKWEKEVPANLRGQIRGNFPPFLRKTDQERVQNLSREIQKWHAEGFLFAQDAFEVTQKLDGSSMTVYFKDGVFGVCSRNLDLKEAVDNSFWVAARVYGLEEALRKATEVYEGREFAVQGELIGPGIQGNPHSVDKLHFYAFDVWSITEQAYFSPQFAQGFCERFAIPYVPLIHMGARCMKTVPEHLAFAERIDHISKKNQAEGVVWKLLESGPYCKRRETFKAISNKYLLQEK